LILIVDIFDGDVEPDWNELADNDVGGCYLKLGEGLSDIGGTLAADRAARCRSAGLFAGFYWFGRPDLGESPQASAGVFAQRLAQVMDSSDFRPALDLERYVNGEPSPGGTAPATSAWGGSFLTALHASWPRLLWYSDADQGRQMSDMWSTWAWIAYYGVQDDGTLHELDLVDYPVGVLAQQYSSIAHIGSYTGDVSWLPHGRLARLLARR
jgi:GH25 family lysozyme M1 (1,4-beta-N-acetylmuramidase)